MFLNWRHCQSNQDPQPPGAVLDIVTRCCNTASTVSHGNHTVQSAQQKLLAVALSPAGQVRNAGCHCAHGDSAEFSSQQLQAGSVR